MKESLVRTWKVKHRAEVIRMQRNGETGDLRVKSLPIQKRGRPLLFGES